MLEALLEILSWDFAAPTISLAEDGDLSLDWQELGLWVCINQDGKINWSILYGAHGTDLAELRAILGLEE